MNQSPKWPHGKQVIIFVWALRHIEQTHMEGLATVLHKMPHTTWTSTCSLRISVQHRPLSYHNNFGNIKINNSLFLKNHCVPTGFYLPAGLHLQGDECSGKSWGWCIMCLTSQCCKPALKLWNITLQAAREKDLVCWAEWGLICPPGTLDLTLMLLATCPVVQAGPQSW